MEPEKLLSTIRKEQGIPNQFKRGTDLAGMDVQLPGGQDYQLQGASEGRRPISQPIPPRQIDPNVVSEQNPLVKRGASVPQVDHNLSDEDRMAQIALKQSNKKSLSDDEKIFVFKKQREAAAQAQQQAQMQAQQNQTQSTQPAEQPKVPDQNGFNLTPEQYLQLSPEQQQAYQTLAFKNQAQKQQDLMSQQADQQRGLLQEREAKAQAELDKQRGVFENENTGLLSEFEASQRAQADRAKSNVEEAGKEGMTNLQNLASRRGFGRSSATAQALQKATAATQDQVRQIEESTGTAISDYKIKLLDRMNSKLEKLENRVLQTQDIQDQFEVDNLKAQNAFVMDLFKQDPSNPQKMVEMADKLKTERIAALKEDREAQKDARTNLQWMISNFGSGAFQNMNNEQLSILADNTGYTPQLLKSLGKTIKEQDSEWEKLKYFDNQDFELNKQQMQNDFQTQRDLRSFDQDIAKIQLGLQKDLALEDFKAQRADAKTSKQVNSLLTSLGVSYGKYADSGNNSGLTFSTPVPHPATKTQVVELNPAIAQAYPDGYRFKANDGPGGLGGQCKWFCQQLTTWPDGSKWTAGSTLADTKSNFEKYRKQGKAFRPGEQEAQVGMSVLTSDSKTAGHGFVINAITPDGKWVATEANYKGPLTVSNSRIVDPKDPKVIGVLKTVPKPQYQVPKTALKGIGSALTQLGPLGQLAGSALNMFGNSQSDNNQEIAQPQQTPEPQGIELTPEQIQGINDLPQEQKQLLINEAPEVYQAYVQAGGAKKNKSDRALTDTAVQNLQKLAGIDSSLKSLNDFYDKIKDVGPAQAARAYNPFDTEARQFDALKQALTGPAARTILQEVGALTDSDLKRVDNLLPTITDTREVAQFKLKQLADLLNSAKTNALDFYGGAGYDVGGIKSLPAFNQQSSANVDDLSLYNSSGSPDLDLWNNL